MCTVYCVCCVLCVHIKRAQKEYRLYTDTTLCTHTHTHAHNPHNYTRNTQRTVSTRFVHVKLFVDLPIFNVDQECLSITLHRLPLYIHGGVFTICVYDVSLSLCLLYLYMRSLFFFHVDATYVHCVAHLAWPISLPHHQIFLRLFPTISDVIF